MTAERTCSLAPFLSPVVAQIGTLEQAGSALEILTQTLENWMAIFKAAVCDDLTEIVEECCGGTTELSFLDLTDTPSSYAGQGGKAVAVNAGATGLEFVDFPTPPDEGPNSVERIILFAQVINNNAVTSTANYIGYGGLLGTNGTLAFGAIASGSVRGATPRRTITSAAGAGSTSSIKGGGTLVVLRGSVAGEGGFRFVTYVGTSTAVAQQRAFIGVHSAAGVIGNVNPSTLLNMIGFAYDSAQTTWRLMSNDGAGAANPVDLGADFPVNATGWFKFEIECQPAANTVEYRATNLVTGVVASGSINTELPVATQMLTAHLWCNNGTTASAVILEFSSFLLEMVQ